METCGCSCTAGCRAWSTAVPSRGRRAQKNVQVSAASGHIPLSSPGYHIYIYINIYTYIHMIDTIIKAPI